MEIYLFIVILLVTLAVIDLSVGVANDAVNFLNAAVGSRAASFRLIMIIAAFGVLAGVTFSSGLMEIARKGIFNPQFFLLSEIMIIFAAVMLTDVLMLDLFNSFGLPTSTTVSIIFELLGASVAISIMKIIAAGDNLSILGDYINTDNVLKIISAIFISILVAYIVGTVIQFLTRLLFTFDFEKRVRRYGALWGGMALTFISYFILLKGAKGASFMTDELSALIQGNMGMIMIASFGFWVVILQLLMWIAKINVLKIIVLAGTFALAMAFAANDLVNFIGAPLAGIAAYTTAINSPDPLTISMGALNEPVRADTVILLIAGVIMVVTLFISRKARSVIHTTVRLSRQEEGYEKFDSNLPSRGIVRMVIVVFDFINKLMPKSVKNFFASRFDVSKYKPELDKDGNPPAFDLVRAAVILVCSAALISLGTSLKLPLSTTYVTFIVAMAAALPDKAWGRESAVYRVSGVLTVIGGWFMTALIAFSSAFIMALIIYYGDIYAIIALVLIIGFVIFRSTILHKRSAKEIESSERKINQVGETPEKIALNYFNELEEFLGNILNSTDCCAKGIQKQSMKSLARAKKFTKKTIKQLPVLHNNILRLARYDSDELIDKGTQYGKVLSSLNSISDHIKYMSFQNYTYFDNNHIKFTDQQNDELNSLFKLILQQLKLVRDGIANRNLVVPEEFNKIKLETKEKIQNSYNNQLKRIKKSTGNLRRSRLFFDNLSDIEAINEHLTIILNISKDIFELYKVSPLMTVPEKVQEKKTVSKADSDKKKAVEAEEAKKKKKSEENEEEKKKKKDN